MARPAPRPPVVAALTAGWGEFTAEQLVHVDSDPAVAGTAVFAEHHGVESLGTSADCVVVAGKRGQDVTLAACVVLSRTRVDVNGAVRKPLGAVRSISQAPAVGKGS